MSDDAPKVPVSRPSIRWPSGDEIVALATEATREAVLMHKKLGIPIVVWKDGQAVEIPPDEIEVDEPVKQV